MCRIRFAYYVFEKCFRKGSTLEKEFFWDFWPLLVHPLNIFHPPFTKSLFKSVIRKSDTTYTNDTNI